MKKTLKLAFRRQFGTYISKSAGYQLSAAWQSGLSNATTCGAFFGILICGQIVEYWGYKRTTMLALVVMIAAIFLPFFASTLPVLLVGEIACGIPWGFASVIGSAYASEIAPVALRGIMTMFIQLCWCIGFFISAGVMYSVSDRTDKASCLPPDSADCSGLIRFLSVYNGYGLSPL